MNTKEFNNEKSFLRKEIVKINLDDDNKISTIEYYTPGGVALKKYQYLNSYNYEKPNQYNIMRMAYALCLFDTKKFYELYKTLNSDSNKEAMRNGLYSVLYEYQRFLTSNNMKDELQEPITNNQKEFSTLGNSLSTCNNQIILDSNNYLDICKRTFLTTGEYSNNDSVLYKRDQKLPYNEKGISYRSLNPNVCREFAKQLCRSDIKEYQRLIDSVSYRDQYYSSIIEGGNSFANSVKRLVKKCQ